MNTNSIAHIHPSAHNVPEADAPIPAICAAPCPACGACVSWAKPTVACHGCGSEWHLTDEQADEFTFALLGLNDVRLDLFLQAIHQEQGGTPPSPFCWLGRAFARYGAAFRPAYESGVA